MTRYCVVSQTTNPTAPQTQITLTQSLAQALALAAHSGEYTHSDPRSARDWSHTFVRIYVVPKGWRMPLDKSLDDLAAYVHSRLPLLEEKDA